MADFFAVLGFDRVPMLYELFSGVRVLSFGESLKLGFANVRSKPDLGCKLPVPLADPFAAVQVIPLACGRILLFEVGRNLARGERF